MKCKNGHKNPLRNSAGACKKCEIIYQKKYRIQNELSKCELVCANCHLIRTNNRIIKAKDTFVGRREKKTHCPQWHEWVKENIYTDNLGRNSCLECRRIRGRINSKKRRENKNK